jgi:hypothetical protein
MGLFKLSGHESLSKQQSLSLRNRYGALFFIRIYHVGLASIYYDYRSGVVPARAPDGSSARHGV